MGDPEENKIKDLVKPALNADADKVSEAGGYSADTSRWNDIDAWEPLPKRFPSQVRHLAS